MKKLTLLCALFLLAMPAFSQQNWSNTRPRDGACFYTDRDFRGGSFCVPTGQIADPVPRGFNDRIRSIEVLGRANVTFFMDGGLRGSTYQISNSIRDLAQLPLREDPRRNWAERISSVRVDGGGGFGRWWRRGDRDDDDRDRDRNGGRDRGQWHRDNDSAYNSNNVVTCGASPVAPKRYCQTNMRVQQVRIIREKSNNGVCQWNQTFGVEDGRLWVGRGCNADFEIR